jgi:esterase/lipase superfamily enzyme
MRTSSFGRRRATGPLRTLLAALLFAALHVSSPPLNAQSGRMVALYSWWSSSHQDHLCTSQPDWAGTPGEHKGTYRFYRREGYIYAPDEAQPRGTLPLYRWWNSSRKDYFTTSNPSWAGVPGQTRSGYQFVRLEGYVLSGPGSGRLPLKSYWSATRTDNVATTDSAWEAERRRGPDYRHYRIDGYLLARPEIVNLPPSTFSGSGTLGTLPIAITAEPADCLPVANNGVLAAVVANEPVAATVRLHFRRASPEREDFYYVYARARGRGRYSALLPRPDASARLGPGYEPVEYFAELIDTDGRVIASSEKQVVKVIEDCQPAPYSPHGEDQNLVLGETALWQGSEKPFHWECTGIVTRVDSRSGALWPDGFCRDFLVPTERPLVPVNGQRTTALPAGARPRDGYESVTVFYGTDRARSGSTAASDYYGTGRSELEVGTVEVSIPADHEIGTLEADGIFEGPDPRQHVLVLSIDPATESGFVQDLSSMIANSDDNDALVFIHGYNVSFEDAARRTAQIAYDLEFSGAPVMYSWPSQAALKGYPIDEANIRWTVPHLSEFLDLVVSSSGAESVHLIAHSMGNRALTEVLRRYAAEALEGDVENSPRFNQIVLVAPDVDADVFRDEIAPRIQNLAERVTLYASENDKALKVSESVHGHPRAGNLSSGVIVAEGVEIVDASDVDTTLFQAVSLGHSYFAEESAVISDLRQILARRTPTERGLMALAVAGGHYWKF